MIFSLSKLIDWVFTQLKTIASDFPPLQKQLLCGLKVLRGKQHDMLAQNIASLEHLNAKLMFPTVPGDNSLKRHRGMFETNAPNN
jgi:hypothetical protein